MSVTLRVRHPPRTGFPLGRLCAPPHNRSTSLIARNRVVEGLSMRALLLLVPFTLLFALVQFPQPSRSAPPPAREKLVDQVKRAIDNGVKFLREQEKGKGHWEHTHVFAQQR